MASAAGMAHSKRLAAATTLAVVLMAVLLAAVPAACDAEPSECECRIKKQCATHEECRQVAVIIGATVGGITGALLLGPFVLYCVVGKVLRRRCCIVNVRKTKYSPLERKYCISPHGMCSDPAPDGAPCMEQASESDDDDDGRRPQPVPAPERDSESDNPSPPGGTGLQGLHGAVVMAGGGGGGGGVNGSPKTPPQLHTSVAVGGSDSGAAVPPSYSAYAAAGVPATLPVPPPPPPPAGTPDVYDVSAAYGVAPTDRTPTRPQPFAIAL